MSASPKTSDSPSSTALSTEPSNGTLNFTTVGYVYLACSSLVADSTSVTVIKSVALCIIMAVAMFGNTLIIVVITKTKTLRRTVNFFLVNMAVSDLIMAFMAIPLQLVEVISGSTAWIVNGVMGKVLCKMLLFLADASYAVSILSMVCIAVDRFCAVVLPMKRNLITGTSRTVAIILTWVLAAIYSSPSLYTAQVITVDGIADHCISTWASALSDHVKAMNVQVVVLIIMFMVIPWLLVAVLYTIMVIESRSKRVLVEGRRFRQRKRVDFRVLKLAMAIVTSFAVCNFPYCAMFLVIAFRWKWTMYCTPPFWKPLWITARFLVLATAGLNPCICFAFSENFRKGFKDVTNAQRSFLVSLISRRPNSTCQEDIDLEEKEEN